MKPNLDLPFAGKAAGICVAVLCLASVARADWPGVRQHVPDSAEWIVSIPGPRVISDRLGALSRAGRLEDPLFNDLLGTLPGVLGLGAGMDWQAPLVVAIENALPAPPLPPLPGQPPAPAPGAGTGVRVLLALSLGDAGALARNFGLPADGAGRVHSVAWLGQAAHLHWDGPVALISTDAGLLQRALAAGRLRKAVPPPPAAHEISVRVNLAAQRSGLRTRLNQLLPEWVAALNQFLHPDPQTAAHRSTAFWGRWIFQGVDRVLREAVELDLILGFPGLPENMMEARIRAVFPPDSAWARHLAQQAEGRQVIFDGPGDWLARMTFDRGMLNLNRGLLDEAAELKHPEYRAALARFLEHHGPAGALLVEPAEAGSSLWQQKRLWIFEKKSPQSLAQVAGLLEALAAIPPAPGQKFRLVRQAPAAGGEPVHTYELKLETPTAGAGQTPFLQAFWRGHAGGFFELDGWLIWLENGSPEDLIRFYRHFLAHPPRLEVEPAVFFRADMHPARLGPALGPFLLLMDPDAQPLLWDQAQAPARIEFSRAPAGASVRLLLPEPPASAALGVLRGMLFAVE